MSKSERQMADGRWQMAERGSLRRVLYCLLPAACCLLLLGCRQDMQDQPRYEAYEASSFFKDGLASRPLPEGTVPRGYLMADKQLYTGKMDRPQGGAATGGNTNNASTGQVTQGGNETAQATTQVTTAEGGALTNAPNGSGGQAAGNQAAGNNAAASNAQQPAGEPDDVETFPFPVTAEVLARGQERYEIFCAMCHGSTGYGDGMIVRRGFRKPPSYHEDRLRQARVGHIFRVITDGYGSMPPYRSQIPVQDRWAIVAYMRALQFSQQNTRQVQPTATTPAHGGNAQPGGHK